MVLVLIHIKLYPKVVVAYPDVALVRVVPGVEHVEHALS